MRKYDLVIVGSGPAGMTAAIYAKRANMNVLLLDKLAPGGQIVNTNEIENYAGVGKIGGADLAMQMFSHCQELEIEFDYKTVNRIEDVAKDKKLIHCEEENEVIETKTVIIATGTKPRTLGVDGEKDRLGVNISFCAICDGAKYKGKDVVVVGGGNSAVDEGTYLAGFVKSLHIVTDFDLTGDAVTSEHLRSLPNVTVHAYKRITDFANDGDKLLVNFVDKESGENPQTVSCDGAFEYIGAIPSTDFIKDLGITNKFGYIEVDEKMSTKMDGVFGAGDCIVKFLRQVHTACNDGAIAALKASEYIKKLAM